MKPRGKKILAGLSLLMMVLCIIPLGAMADDNVTDTNGTDAMPFDETFRGRGPMGPGPDIEMQEFDTEEEELDFVRERTIEAIENRIEMLENFDEDADGNVTAESVEEVITNLEALIDEVNNAESLDDLKKITADVMGPAHGMGRQEMEKPEFDTEEEEIEFVKERTTEHVDRTIEILENIELEDSDELTDEDINSIISQLEDIKASLDYGDLTLDDLGTIREDIFRIMESVRDVMPAPEESGEKIPRHRGPMEETDEN